MAGYPDSRSSVRIADSLIRGGADAIEIGIPFSDPVADGPTIQKASTASLQAGMTPSKALGIARSIRSAHARTPLLAMTYSNIILRNGISSFLHSAKLCGIDGFVIPDLPVEEAGEFIDESKIKNLDTVFLASPNTPKKRIERIAGKTTGFLYLVSVYGTTGSRAQFEQYSADAIASAKAAVAGKVPVAVGFGISRPAHVKFMNDAGADAVIVGSAIVDIITRRKKMEDGLRELESFARRLKRACR